MAKTESSDSTKPRFFYGWWIVAGAMVSQFCWMGAGPAVVGVFLRPVTDDLGWHIWQFTLGSSLASAGGALSGIIAGQVLDRHGPRPLLLLGTAVATVCFVGLSLQSNLWVFLALYAVTGLIGWSLFSSLVASAAISKWFVARRGWALAIGSIGVSLAGIIVPVTATFVVDRWDWRVGYVAIAIFILIAMTPVAFLMRRTPEDYGLLPDGARSPSSESSGAPAQDAKPGQVAVVEPRSLTRSEALRTSGFWFLVAGFACSYTALSAVLAHAIPFATDAGFSRAVAASALGVNGLGNLASKAFWGYGLQRFDARRLAAFAYSVSSTGVALLIVAGVTGNQTTLFPALFFYGFGFGGTVPVSEFLWARYFGRKHLGAIRGVGNPMAVLGTGLGPVVLGAWFDATGNYTVGFMAAICSYVLGALMVNLSQPPQREAAGGRAV